MTPERAAEIAADEMILFRRIAGMGKAGYPITRYAGGRHWSWTFRSLGVPTVYPTKREAVASFEAYYDHVRGRCMAKLQEASCTSS